jgi:hypothetical protein
MIPELKINLKPLDHILSMDGFSIFIDGRRGKGKTAMSLSIAEYSFDVGFRSKVATNIWTENYRVQQQIINFPDLIDWLKTDGKKLFILDEAGKHIQKMRFMSDINVKFASILQLIRHYDCGFIYIAPSIENIDKMFIHRDLCDAIIHKISLTRAIVEDQIKYSSYFLEGIPLTSIKFKSKDLAEFFMKRSIPKPIKGAQCCQVAQIYAEYGRYEAVKQTFPQLDNKEIQRLIIRHLKHTASDSDKESVKVHDSIENP